MSANPRPPLPPGPYLVVGLARSGQAIARVIASLGEEVIGVDAAAPEGASDIEGVDARLESDGVTLVDAVRCVVKSPGVPRQAPVIAAARERGREVIGELELAWRLLPNRCVAITGTNGKTTVSEMCGEIWRAAGKPVAVAGNVGTPLASLVGSVSEETTVICECSSFQLEDSAAFAPECAVLLNVAPDHLDRHGSLDEYLEAKLRAFANQGNDDVAIWNGCDPPLQGKDLGGCGRRVAFCGDCEGDECEIWIEGGAIVATGKPLMDLSRLQVAGRHNAENAMAAAAAGLAMGISREAVVEGLAGFAGIPHRLERVAERDGVVFVNDSKATNVAAARAAILAFEGGVHAILGGSPKGESFEGLAEAIAERCAAAYLVGRTAEALERDLSAAWDADVPHERYAGLADAFAAAAAAASPGEVVLLAPAAASFDAYRDFEERGEHFRSLVAAL